METISEIENKTEQEIRWTTMYNFKYSGFEM